MIGWHPSNCQDRPNQPDYLWCLFSIVESRRGTEHPHGTSGTLITRPSPPPPANFYPQLTSRCLPPECVPSSSHLLCSSTLTYCLEAGNARHSGLAWALCLRSSRRYLVDHRPVEIFERQNGLAEILLCYQQIFRHFRLESDTKTLETNSNNIWEQYSCSER